jgi:hypothetical protein
MKQHKWHKEIKAWADGAEIEYSYYTENDVDIWLRCEEPLWNEREKYQYRIKPQPKEPQYLYVYKDYGELCLLEDKIAKPAEGIKYVGKIKLEDEDV